MSRTKIMGGGVAVVVLAGLGIAWASGDWSSARSKADINEDNEFREIRADWKRDCS